jgi:hypothetical protein
MALQSAKLRNIIAHVERSGTADNPLNKSAIPPTTRAKPTFTHLKNPKPDSLTWRKDRCNVSVPSHAGQKRRRGGSR